MIGKRIVAEHGVVCAMPTDFFGYFGWPSVATLGDGTLVTVASGLRNEHMCPFGRTTIFFSRDNGHNWSMPRVINDSPLDDRDAGVTCVGGKRLLVTWFTTDRRPDYKGPMASYLAKMEQGKRQRWLQAVSGLSHTQTQRFQGSWVRVSPDGGDTWEEPVRVPVTSPHGGIRLSNGHLVYLGKLFQERHQLRGGCIAAAGSPDGGYTWQLLGKVPLAPGLDHSNCHEPHVVQLPSGKLIGMIRVQNSARCDVTACGYIPFSIFSTESDDEGRNWTPMRPLGFHGAPPSIIHHSSGALVLTYGYRSQPYGQRIAFSLDEGRTWDHDWVLRDDGPDHDLGYPSTVELADRSLLTVYYQKPAETSDRCAILWSRWDLPIL